MPYMADRLGATTGNGDGLIRTQSLALNDTHIINSHWLNEFRFGLNRWGLVFSPIDFGTNPRHRASACRV